MPTKKPKSTAKVELDAKTVHRFESALRQGLVASGAVMASENKKPGLKSYSKVELDPDTVARLSEILRDGLVSSNAVMATDNEQLDKMTAKVKKRRSRSKKAR
jgi:hypothetical protein